MVKTLETKVKKMSKAISWPQGVETEPGVRSTGTAAAQSPEDVEIDLERALWDVDYRNLVKSLLNRAAARQAA